MARKIDTDANINSVRFAQQTSHPSSPASGYESLYVVSGSAHGGLYVKDSAGRQIGPFITGTASAAAGGIVFPSFTAPVDGDFAWINQGTATVTTNANGGICLYTPKTANDQLRIRKKTAPATPYTITACIIPAMATDNYSWVGLCFRQSSDGKVHGFGPIGFNGQYITSSKFTNATTFSATYVNFGQNSRHPMYLRIQDTGANRVCSVSMDGYNFITIHTVGRTDFLTADEVGFFVNPNNANWDTALTVLSWVES